MRALLTTILMLFTFQAMAIDGENTGHFMSMAYSKVQVIVTRDQKIPKSQVESVVFKPNAPQTLGNIEVLRVGGVYITAQDITGAIAQ